MAISNLYVITGKYNHEPLLICNSKEAAEAIAEPFGYADEDHIVEVTFIMDDTDDDSELISTKQMIELLAKSCVCLIDNIQDLQERIDALESQVHDA